MYKRLLCLIGNGPDADQVLRRACEACDIFGAELLLLRVVEFLPVTGAEDAMLATPLVMADEMEAQAREQVEQLAKDCGISTELASVVQGEFVDEVARYVNQHQVDLVVAGKHERRGLAAWFNHAEDDILHGSPCDILAVHLTR